MVNKRVMHIPKSHHQRQGNRLTGGRPKKLVIHSTANTAPAINERNNLARKSNKRFASFHDVVDDKEVIECIPHDEIAFHAGTCNRTSVSLEICEGGNRSKTLDNAVKHSASLLKRHNLTINDMIRHYDCTGKNCPRIMSANNWKEWYVFKSLVNIELQGGNKMTKEQIKKIVRETIKEEQNKTNNRATQEWQKKPIKFVTDKAFMQGYEDGTFKPHKPVTRGELAQVLYNLYR